MYASVYMADGFYVTEDVASITADYLIRHIDASFKLFEYSWVKELPFEIFLEYVLPYRLEYERLNLWRDSLGVLKQSTEAQEAIDEYKYDASRVSLKLDAESDVSYQNSVQLFERDVRNDCHYMYLSEVFCDRIKGIPSVLDFFPYYSNRNGSHYWHNIVYLLIGILHSYQEVLGIFPERFIVGHIPIIFFYRQGKMNIYLLCFEIRLIKTLQMYIFKPVI